jgi:hypothetical protein
MSKSCLVGISFYCWPLLLFTYRESLLSLTAKVCAISRLVCAPGNPSWIMGFQGKVFRNIGQRQRTSRRANVRRLRSGTDFHRPRTVCDLPFGAELSETVHALDSTTMDLCLGLSPGKIPRPQKCREIAHAAGSARAHFDQCLCDRRAGSECQYSGPSCFPKLEHFT